MVYTRETKTLCYQSWIFELRYHLDRDAMSSLNLLINSSCPFGQHTPPFSCNLNDLVYYPETFLKSEFPSENKLCRELCAFPIEAEKTFMAQLLDSLVQYRMQSLPGAYRKVFNEYIEEKAKGTTKLINIPQKQRGFIYLIVTNLQLIPKCFLLLQLLSGFCLFGGFFCSSSIAVIFALSVQVLQLWRRTRLCRSIWKGTAASFRLWSRSLQLIFGFGFLFKETYAKNVPPLESTL